MRSILPFLLVLWALAAPAWPDVLLPGEKRVEHRLVLEPSEHLAGRRIVAAPVRGFEGTHVVEPGVPFSFSMKYGTRIYVVPESESVPDDVDEGWKAGHPSAEIPVQQVTSAPIASALQSVVTTLRVRGLTGERVELEVLDQHEVRDARVLVGMGVAAALGVSGLALLLRRRRRAASVV